jgi:hypothetical protein
LCFFLLLAVSLSWKQVDDPLHLLPTDQCGLGVIDDYVYLFGGRYDQDTASNRLWIYSISKVGIPCPQTN